MPRSSSPSPPPDPDALLSTLKAHAPTVRQTTAGQRAAKLRRLADALVDRRALFAEALHADFRKAPVEVDLTEIKTVTKEIDHACAHLEEWMAPDTPSAPLLFTGTHSEIRYEPKGVVLILSPWNYPVTLTLGPLIGAIAAGNCAVLKPSEHAPNTATALQGLVEDLFDDREIRLVQGGPDLAETLTAQPFDHVYFTGSPAIGRRVMRAAAEHLTSVTLELGGKSPAVVDATADLDSAAERIVWSKFTNAGQTCIAPDYLLVEDRIHESFVERLRGTIHRFYGESPEARKASPDYARLIHDDHFERVTGLLDEARANGAAAAIGGATDAASRYVAPTELTDVPTGSRIMQEEIFGPLLPVLPYSALEEAVHAINERPSPLSLYLFTEREATVDTILTRTTAGSTCVNEGFLHFVNPNLPFGGKGESGIGRGHGRYSFQEFSNERAVLRRRYGGGLLRALFPPYGRLTSRIAEWAMRYV